MLCERSPISNEVHGDAYCCVMDNEFADFYKEIEDYYNVELRRNVRTSWEEYWAWFVAYYYYFFYLISNLLFDVCLICPLSFFSLSFLFIFVLLRYKCLLYMFLNRVNVYNYNRNVFCHIYLVTMCHTSGSIEFPSLKTHLFCFFVTTKILHIQN